MKTNLLILGVISPLIIIPLCVVSVYKPWLKEEVVYFYQINPYIISESILLKNISNVKYNASKKYISYRDLEKQENYILSGNYNFKRIMKQLT